MAWANVELVRSIWAEWERGDYSSVDWQDPEIEFVIADGPTPGQWRGAAGIREGWGGMLDAWEGFHAEAGEYRELDAERVLVLSPFGGRGKASGVELGQLRTRQATLLHLHGGKVTRMVIYFDGERALAELGLTAEAGAPQQSLEVVRTLCETVASSGRGDPALFAPDFELHFPPEMPEAGVSRGYEAASAAIAQFEEALDDLIYEPVEYLDGGDEVVAVIRYRGSFHHTGVEVDDLAYWVFTVADGKVTRQRNYTQRADALAAAGLSE